MAWHLPPLSYMRKNSPNISISAGGWRPTRLAVFPLPPSASERERDIVPSYSNTLIKLPVSPCASLCLGPWPFLPPPHDGPQSGQLGMLGRLEPCLLLSVCSLPLKVMCLAACSWDCLYGRPGHKAPPQSGCALSVPVFTPPPGSALLLLRWAPRRSPPTSCCCLSLPPAAIRSVDHRVFHCLR
jgi:hypothetical protein